MGSWWPSMSGRYSPFTALYSRTTEPPQVTEDDYSYMTGQDQPTLDDGSAPDVLNLRHKGSLVPLQFPAYAISDASLTVGEVRRAAARLLHVDSVAAVKLLYKGRQLRDDAVACKHEKLKQNSELLCVVSEENSDDLLSEPEAQESIRRKRKGHRGGKKKGKTKDETDSSPAPVQRTAPSPADALLQVQDNFVTNLLPCIEAFLTAPPDEPKARDLEYKKLSEVTLAQVLIKLDGVETGGNEELRAKRREIIKLAQGWLNKLDSLHKSWAPTS